MRRDSRGGRTPRSPRRAARLAVERRSCACAGGPPGRGILGGRVGRVSAADIDRAAEGMLEGLGEPARRGRVRLLDQLTSDGLSIDELRRAIDEGRLAALPAML